LRPWPEDAFCSSVARACDLVVAAERACFLLGFVNLGLCPDLGLGRRRQGGHIVRGRARAPVRWPVTRRRVCLQLVDKPQLAHAGAAEV
jgi:hypothetical protein